MTFPQVGSKRNRVPGRVLEKGAPCVPPQSAMYHPPLSKTPVWAKPLCRKGRAFSSLLPTVGSSWIFHCWRPSRQRRHSTEPSRPAMYRRPPLISGSAVTDTEKGRRYWTWSPGQVDLLILHGLILQFERNDGNRRNSSFA